MTKVAEMIDKYELYAKCYTYQERVRILTLDQEKVVVKEKKKNKKALFDYLDSKDFPYVLKPTNLEANDNFEIYPFIEQKIENKEEKAVDMMYVMSLLHNKTSFYKDLVLDDIKAIYEEMNTRIEYLYYYYHDLQDMLERKVYMAPDEYLLMRNITLVYLALDYSKNTIDLWYEKIKDKKSVRYAQLHNGIETDHFLFGKNAYLISWDHARKDIPIYDFLHFFRKEYEDLDMTSLFNIYKHKYPFTEEERLLFFSLLAMPIKLELGNNTYNKYSEVYHFIIYLNRSREFLSKQDEHYQKTN